MAQARGFWTGRGTGCELDVHDIIRIETVVRQCVPPAAIFHHMFESPDTLVIIKIYPALRVVHDHYIS
jgi:hypothetical protein